MYHTEKVNASLRHRSACINLYILWVYVLRPFYPPDVIVEVSPDDSGKVVVVAESCYYLHNNTRSRRRPTTVRMYVTSHLG